MSLYDNYCNHIESGFMSDNKKINAVENLFSDTYILYFNRNRSNHGGINDAKIKIYDEISNNIIANASDEYLKGVFDIARPVSNYWYDGFNCKLFDRRTLTNAKNLFMILSMIDLPKNSSSNGELSKRSICLLYTSPSPRDS